MKWDEEKRATYDAEFAPVRAALEHFPLARTAPFFDVPEREEKGTGGLLSITINPETCKGCDVCVAVCDDGALVTVDQTDEEQEVLEANWALWRNLPETDDRYIRIGSGGDATEDGDRGALTGTTDESRERRILSPGSAATAACALRFGW